MKWTEEYRINVHDTDLNGIVSVSGLLRYMQDTANLQMAGQGPSWMNCSPGGIPSFSAAWASVSMLLCTPMT